MAKLALRLVTGTGLAVALWAGALADRAQAQDFYCPPGSYANGQECDDCDDCGHNWCAGLSFCNKLRLHCAYSHRKFCRPYRRMNSIPPELAPYIGPGTWHSAGYGAPSGGAACPPYAAAPMASYPASPYGR